MSRYEGEVRKRTEFISQSLEGDKRTISTRPMRTDHVLARLEDVTERLLRGEVSGEEVLEELADVRVHLARFRNLDPMVLDAAKKLGWVLKEKGSG